MNVLTHYNLRQSRTPLRQRKIPQSAVSRSRAATANRPMQLSRAPAGVHATCAFQGPSLALPIGGISARNNSSISRQHFHAHPQPVRARGQLQVLGSSSDDILKKYGLTPAGESAVSNNSSSSSSNSSSNKPAPIKQQTAAPLSRAAGNGVFLLLLLNVVLFVLDHVLHIPGIQGLYLNHAKPQWYQWVTHAFCHANWQHLSMNLFNLCVFGKMVEETEGASGVIFAYLVTAVGAAVASVLLQPAVHRGVVSVSLGASGAIFGLFAVSVLTRLSWDPRKLLEGAILGQFVVDQVLNEARMQAVGGMKVGGLAVGHIAHLGGALAGVLLVWLLSKLPDPDAKGV